MDKLIGRLAPVMEITGRLTDIQKISGYLTTPLVVAPEAFGGPYLVIPKAYETQILFTDGLVMEDDVTVTEIPYFESDNEADGKTITIAFTN